MLSGAAIWSLTFLSGPFIFTCLLFNPLTAWFAILLFIWNRFEKSPYTGGYRFGYRKRASDWLRELSIWKGFRQYFPSKIVVQGKLEKDGKYLLSYHPHGVIGLGVFSQFVYSFPHLKDLPIIRPATLNANLIVPFLRTLALLNGFISCDYESLKYVLDGKHLKKGEPQESVLLVTGGGHEAQFTRSKSLTVAINNKSGFIRLCMETGAKLVPVIAFGENDTFYIFQEEDCRNSLQKQSFKVLKYLQTFLRRHFGFSLIFFYGEPVIPFLPFPFNLPIVPRKVPLTVVIGNPIAVPNTENPTKQQIEIVKEEFKRQIRIIVSENGEPFGIKKVNFQ